MSSSAENNIPELLKKGAPTKLIESDVIKLAEDVMTYLISKQDYEDDDTLMVLKGMGQIYWKHRKLRKTFADKLAEKGFAEKAHSMLTGFNKTGLFKNDSVWFPTYYTLNNCWNYSDISLDLSKKLVEAGFVTMMLANISHQPYLDNQNNKNVIYVLKSSLSILQNTAKAPGSPLVFREQNAPALLKPFTTSENEFFKVVAMMCITAVISDAENAVLEDTGTIKFMVQAISKALNNPKRRHRGFSPTELAECLGRMAVNDANKIKVVDEGALPLFVNMMAYKDEAEQYAAAGAIWTLSFDKNVKEKIMNEANCVSSLETLSTSENGKVRQTANGALWIIKDSASKENTDDEKNSGIEPAESKEHVFISYQWANQQIIVQLANRLKADGFRVWVDVEQMGGSTLEAMALAVENAALVLIGMSEKYKISPNCRTEAEYTFRRKKPFVPLMMQRGYDPDGWLGMLLGAKLYINFDGKYEFEHAYQMLLKEVKDRGRGAPAQVQTSQTVSGNAIEAPIQSAFVQPTGASLPFTEPTQPKVATWKKDDVKKWLKENKLERLEGTFKEYEGKALKQLYKMKCQAPEYFYNALDKKFEMSMMDILLFVDALENLPK